MTLDPTPSPQYEIPEELASQPVKPASPGKSFFSELLQTLLLAALLYFAIDAVFARVRVLNISMQPTLFEGNIVLVNKLAYKFGDMKTGDVVIFHDPYNRQEDFIKRLIGKPGDQVTVNNGEVYVNGNKLVEPYIASEPAYSGVWQVPEDSIFVLGDNRNQSSDSHSWGFVPLTDVVGKALIVYWPLDEIKLVTHHQPVSAATNINK
jgi:signal peptidase I